MQPRSAPALVSVMNLEPGCVVRGGGSGAEGTRDRVAGEPEQYGTGVGGERWEIHAVAV